MKLEKEPQTEVEYWMIIEALGGYAWAMDHDLADGRIQDPKGEIDKEIEDARQISIRFVLELGEKFGVIAPKDCPKVKIGEKPPRAPKGKIYYWNWYEKMKKLVYKIEYEKIICSACPFSTGAKNMGAHIPCGVFPGILYRLHEPFVCGMITSNLWTREELLQNIRKGGGEVTIVRFKIKEIGLKSLFDPSTEELKI